MTRVRVFKLMWLYVMNCFGFRHGNGMKSKKNIVYSDFLNILQNSKVSLENADYYHYGMRLFSVLILNT